jgi:hypothetical protein
MRNHHRFLASRILITGAFAAIAAFAQFKAEPAGAPPADVPAPFSQALQKEGTKMVDAQGAAVSEIWLVSQAPNGPKSGEENVTLPNIPHGSLLGVIRFPKQWNDRRGQVIKPGVYTLRYSMFPINGDHQGVAPQRDFMVLTKMSDDTDPKAAPNFDTLMNWSRKASGTPHPLVMSIWKADDPKPDFSKQGETDWVLQRKMGDTMLAIVMAGKASA